MEPKRASGPVRHAVRVEVLLIVAERGPHPWPSQRAAARELAARLGYGVSTVRRALADPTLAAELELAVRDLGDPVSHQGATEGATEEPPHTDPETPQVSDPPAGSPPPPSPHVSTSALLYGAAVVPPASPGRRPREVRRSRFAGRCVLCLEELDVGLAWYLVPYDTGTAVYCLDHAALGLAMAQMFYDVTRGRPIPAELELYVRPPKPTS